MRPFKYASKQLLSSNRSNAARLVKHFLNQRIQWCGITFYIRFEFKSPISSNRRPTLGSLLGCRQGIKRLLFGGFDGLGSV